MSVRGRRQWRRPHPDKTKKGAFKPDDVLIIDPNRVLHTVENPNCPTPFKRSFSSESTAWGNVAYLADCGHQTPYLCACGSWHLTSQNARKDAR